MKKNHLTGNTIAFYFVVLLCFALYLVYMSLFEHNQVFSARSFEGVSTFESASETVIPDPAAPAGVRRQFVWTLSDTEANEDSLAFYLVHHYAQVWFDDELVYSLTPGTDNRFGDSPSSNWVMLPLKPSDSGKQVTVLLTPAYESVIGRRVEFLIGPRYAIVMGQLKADLPQIVLSALCILMGLVLVVAQHFLHHQKKVADWELFYLGFFTLLIGVWRIIDTRSSPLLFPQNPMLLGYITIAALFLLSAPLPLYLRTRYTGYEKPLLVVALISTLAAAAVLVCQILNLADLRQMLTVSHAMLILNLVVLLWVCVRSGRRGTDHSGNWKLILLLAAGFVIDITWFYARGTSSGLLFTMVTLLIYAALRFASGILSASRKAYTDLKTGLFNKNRWDDLMHQPWHESGHIGIMMLDLNRLKHINDTMGHEAGDKMIYNFANILRNAIPPTNTICRWGGDEFTVLITDASRTKMEQYTAAIASSVARYNTSEELPKIHYAAGWMLSADFPELTPQELLIEADKCMYEDKQQWYAANVSKN